MKKIISILALILASSCAMIGGNKFDQISITSQPAGADVFVEGKFYGRTPLTVKLEAKNSVVNLVKNGYGSSEIKLQAFATMKSGHCVADALTSMFIVPLYSLVFSGNCSEFTKKDYFVTIAPSYQQPVGINGYQGNQNYPAQRRKPNNPYPYNQRRY